MAVQDWLDDVRLELTNLGVSACYRARFLDELRDHIAEILHEKGVGEMSTEALSGKILERRLGKPTEVARAAHNTVAQRYYAQRHPVITYVLLPVPVLLLLFVGYAAALVGILSAFGGTYPYPTWVELTAKLLMSSLAYVPAVLLTVALAWIATRCQTGTRWWLAGSVLVAAVAGMLMVTFQMPTTPGTGQFTVGFAFPPQFANWLQMVIPLAITAAFWIYALRTRNPQEPRTSADN